MTGIVDGGNSTGSAITIGTNDNFALNFETNNTTAMTISNSGNIGIGTTNPSAALELQDTVAGTFNAITITNPTPISWGQGSKIKFEGNGGIEMGNIQSL